MNIHKYKILFVFIGFAMCSCSNYLDINQDPDKPTEATILDLMPVVQTSTAFAFSNNLNRIGGDVVQYFVGRYDGWAISESDLSNDWRFNLYAGGLKDIEDLIGKAESSGNYHFSGIAKLLKAYSYSLMVDIWNDIPYTEAINDEISSPKFDEARGIYNSLFTLIDEAIADLDKTNQASLEDVDMIYGGNVASWKRMANTLKLKMYLQLRHVDPTKAKSEIEALIQKESSNPGSTLITEASQDFNYYFGVNSTPENRNLGFQTDYKTKGETHINNFFYDFMFGKNDPRIPYYFYKQSGDFEGRNEGDPEGIGNDADTRTVQGIFSCGGKYDDGSARAVSGSSASGDGEFRMLTGFMTTFMEIEAALTLNATVSDDARSLFEKAMKSVFDEVNSLDAPNISTTDRDAYINTRLADYDATTSNDDKLKIVIEERWISQFGNALESYNDLRRTGYPELPAPIETNDLFPNRLPYPDDELSANPNAPKQPENNTKVFWME